MNILLKLKPIQQSCLSLLLINLFACTETIQNANESGIFLDINACVSSLSVNADISSEVSCQPKYGCLWLKNDNTILGSKLVYEDGNIQIENQSIIASITNQTSDLKGSIAFYQEAVECNVDIDQLNQCKGNCLYIQEFTPFFIEEFDQRKVFTLNACQWQLSDALAQQIDTSCDQIDNDCDGKTDENQQKKSNETCLLGVGACQSQGQYLCTTIGQEPECVVDQIISAMPEICNGIDDDCDGQVDDDLEIVSVSCGQGVCLSQGNLICQRGVEINTCSPAPPAENDQICNGLDDDCNGNVDEDYQSQTITCGVDTCAQTAASTCKDGIELKTCEELMNANVIEDRIEICDGIDNDCNGLVDENLQPMPIDCSVGVCLSTGVVSCQNGTSQSSCITPMPNDAPEFCDGLDNNCNGQTDEGIPSESTQCGVGVCARSGMKTCTNGSFTDSCIPNLPNATPETICNGLDDDCDGQTDEDFQVQNIECGVNACLATGILYCDNGEEKTSCYVGTPNANDATCDGIDEDCDSRIDEDVLPVGIVCGQGACQATGDRICSNGRLIERCTPGVVSIEEIDQSCNRIDNDCDGRIDEGYTSAISCGLGVCENTGIVVCEDGAPVSRCMPRANQGEDIDCDFVDEDCDGRTDEGYPAVGILCGTGVCQAGGDRLCVSGQVLDLCTPRLPTLIIDSTCNGSDEDCDGRTDESFVSVMATCGVGACQNTGTTRCSNGSESLNCMPRQPTGIDDDCDHIDDDCDGSIDEDYPAISINCGVGSCSATGQQICIQGQVVNTCVPNQNAPDQQCDGLDNDCDGRTDEGYQPTAITCGLGACRNNGSVICVNGALVSSCIPKAPKSEICNGIDDDCDGLVDDNLDLPVSCGIGACRSTGTNRCIDGAYVNDCRAGLPSSEVFCPLNSLDEDCDGTVDEATFMDPVYGEVPIIYDICYANDSCNGKYTCTATGLRCLVGRICDGIALQ